MTVQIENIKKIALWIVNSRSMVVFTGAGLSTESGIPDYRSPGGIWERYDPEDFYFDKFISSETSRHKYWKMATEMYEPMKKAVPNAAHIAVAELERLGMPVCVITQNIDGLHHRAGTSKERLIEIHGSAMYVSCLKCMKHYDRDVIQEKIRNGLKIPYCDDCRGILKPATISFGQSMPEKETEAAYIHSSQSDLFIAIGSSLAVYPAASMPSVAKRNGARLVIINRDPTPYDDLADIVIHGLAGQIMTSILEHVKMAEPSGHDHL